VKNDRVELPSRDRVKRRPRP